MKIENLPLNKIKPYERNPRKNDSAVNGVAESIKQFGFQQPIVIDKDGVIVAGHTRYKAAKKLKLKEVPCVRADDLTPEQVKAYRIADNKLNELAAWDFELLGDELQTFDFDFEPLDFVLPPFSISYEPPVQPEQSRIETPISQQDDESADSVSDYEEVSPCEDEPENTSTHEVPTTSRQQAESEWVGMPDCTNVPEERYCVTVNFTSVEDKLRFGEILGQPITGKTRSICWPEPKERVTRIDKEWQ